MINDYKRRMSRYDLPDKYDIKLTLTPNEYVELRQVFKTAFRIHKSNDSMPLLLNKWQKIFDKITLQHDNFIKDNYDGTGKIVGEDQTIVH